MLWVGTAGGLARYMLEINRWLDFSLDDDNNVKFGFKASNGVLWFAYSDRLRGVTEGAFLDYDYEISAIAEHPITNDIIIVTNDDKIRIWTGESWKDPKLSYDGIEDIKQITC